MPRIEPYEQRTTPGGGLGGATLDRAPVVADAGAGLADIGRGLAGIIGAAGDAVEQRRAEADARKQREARIEGALAAARAKAEIDIFESQLDEQEPDLLASDRTKRITEHAQSVHDRVLTETDNEYTRNYLRANVGVQVIETQARAVGIEAGLNVAKRINDVNDAIKLASSNVARDPTSFDSQMRIAEDAAMASSRDPGQRARAVAVARESVMDAWIDGERARGNSAALLQQVESRLGKTGAPPAAEAAVAERDANAVQADFAAIAAKHPGVELGSGYRTQAEQDALIARGATKAKRSYHTRNLARDFKGAFLRDPAQVQALIADLEAHGYEAIYEDGKSAGTAPHVHAEPRDDNKVASLSPTAPSSAPPSSVHPAIADLSPDALFQLYGQLQADIERANAEAKAQQAAQRQITDQRLQDEHAARMDGQSVPLAAEQTFIDTYGEGRGQVIYQQQQAVAAAGGAFARLKMAPPAERAAIMAAHVPQGTENYEARAAVYDSMVRQNNAIVAALKSDPGAYVLENDAGVKRAFVAASTDPGKLPGAYALLGASQVRLGVPQPKLPQGQVQAIQTDFEQNIETQPEVAVAHLRQAADVAPSFADQIATATGNAGRLAVEGVPPRVVQQYWALSRTPDADLKKGIDASAVEDAVTTAMADLSTTLRAQGADDADAFYRKAITTLTYGEMRAGNGEPTDAAARAYAKVAGDLYAFHGTYRVPTSEGIDADHVAQGLDRVLAGLDGTDVRADALPGLSAAENADRTARTLRERAHWINDEDGTGVYLVGWDGILARRADGSLFHVTFADAMAAPRVAQEYIGLDEPRLPEAR